MKWDYDKLFAVGNVIGIKYLGKISNDFINENDDRDYLENLMNENLADEETTEEIQYIIRLDEHGNVIEHLFDRDKDMPKHMPELTNGMFVEVHTVDISCSSQKTFGLVTNELIVCQDGEWYMLDIWNDNGTCQSNDECYITRVWDEGIYCFNDCKYNIINPIWERK